MRFIFLKRAQWIRLKVIEKYIFNEKWQIRNEKLKKQSLQWHLQSLCVGICSAKRERFCSFAKFHAKLRRRHCVRLEFQLPHNIFAPQKEDANHPICTLPCSKAHKAAERYSQYRIFSDSMTIPPEEWASVAAFKPHLLMLHLRGNTMRTKARLFGSFLSRGRERNIPHSEW